MTAKKSIIEQELEKGWKKLSFQSDTMKIYTKEAIQKALKELKKKKFTNEMDDNEDNEPTDAYHYQDVVKWSDVEKYFGEVK